MAFRGRNIRNLKNEVSLQNVRGRLDDALLYFQSNPGVIPEKPLENLLNLFQDLTTILNYFLTDSSNSGTPPSQDPDRPKKKRKKSKKKVGGQTGHAGHHLGHDPNPNDVINVPMNQADLPSDKKCHKTDEYVARQVYDIRIRRHVTEYRAEVWVDEDGKRYVASFPPDVKSYAQYGNVLKALAIDLFVWQMLPFERAKQFFHGAFGIPISASVLQNFNKSTYDFLVKTYKPWAKNKILESPVAYFDETFINVNGKHAYLMTACTDKVILLEAFPDRTKESIMAMGILPYYKGIAVTDCYGAYLNLNECIHVLCGVHLLRDLKAVEEKDGMNWAKRIRNFFLKLKDKVENAGGSLDDEELEKEIKCLERLIKKGYEETEDKKEDNTIRGRCLVISSKSMALLNRLTKRMENYLVFAAIPEAPFDNTTAERSFRMFKVWLKISGCFKSLETANIIALIRSYISTCQNYGMTVEDAIQLALNKELPYFMQDAQSPESNISENDCECVENLNVENYNYNDFYIQDTCDTIDNNIAEQNIKDNVNIYSAELNNDKNNNPVIESNIKVKDVNLDNKPSLVDKVKSKLKKIVTSAAEFFTGDHAPDTT